MRSWCRKNLTQKLLRQQVCSDFLERLEEDSGLIKNIITWDETWIFQYDVETKRQSMHWNQKSKDFQIKIQGNVDRFFFSTLTIS